MEEKILSLKFGVSRNNLISKATTRSSEQKLTEKCNSDQ